MSTRGRKAEAVEIEGALTEVPPVSACIADDMAAEWHAVADDLLRRKLLTEAMRGSIDTYVMAQRNRRLAQEALDLHGVLVTGADGALKQTPAAALLGRSEMIISRLGAELGLTPSAQARKGMKPQEGDDDDYFGDLLD